jgi:hypothetical protein
MEGYGSDAFLYLSTNGGVEHICEGNVGGCDSAWLADLLEKTN